MAILRLFRKKIIDWDYLQQNSNDILAEGLSLLLEGHSCEFGGRHPKEPGNYVISYSEIPLYIGEATDLEKRLKQHYKGSTFYRNYCKNSVKLNLPSNLSMDDFRCRFMPTKIGRKELEEFGIVNLPAPLNEFHKDKRDRFTPVTSSQSWEIVQENALKLLEQGERIILFQRPFIWNEIKPLAVPGIYIIFNEQEELIYIGESTDLKERYDTHSRRTHFSAFRRHVATKILSLNLKTKAELGYKSADNKRRHVTSSEDEEINRYISKCSIITMPVYFGRLELEERLIKRYQPLLNRKGNKNIDD